jgi:hypothetical protein
VRLDRDDVEAIALRTAEILAERGLVAPAAPRLLSAAQAADRIGMSRDFVYEHARELGAVRVGDSSRPRLRFDPRRLDEWVSARSGGGGSERPGPARGAASGRRRRTRPGRPLDLLPIAPENGARTKAGGRRANDPAQTSGEKAPETRPERTAPAVAATSTDPTEGGRR